MEIQDRNTIIQQISMQKLNFFQVTDTEGNAFSDMLKLSEKGGGENEPKSFADLREVNSKTSKPEAVDVKKTLPERNNEEEKKAPSKSEDVKTETREKADNKQKTDKKGVSDQEVSQEAVSENVSERPEQQNLEHNEDIEEEAVETIQVEDIALVEDVFEDSDGAVAEDQVKDLMVALPMASEENVNTIVLGVEETIAPVDVVETKVVEPLKDVEQKHDKIVDGEGNVENIPEIQTEDQNLLVEQARYLDEKASFGRKLKIEVDVKEEKIAAPIAKDVLKNRFEIDSLFQSVDSETQEFFESYSPAEIVEASPKSQVTLQPQLSINVAPAIEGNSEMNSQEVTSAKVAEIIVSGKENVLETTNVLRNETFAKINETTARDNVRGMSKEVVEQIKVNITKSAIKGIDTVEIQLKPEDLGRIQIKMHIAKDGRLQADIVASRAETLDMLQKEVSDLAEAFNNAGYNTDTKSFNFAFQKDNQSEENQDADRLASFLSEKIDQETEVLSNDNLFYDPALGLNIRV